MKFISELDAINNPADAEEMTRHVFGANYARDREGSPVEMGGFSEYALRAAKVIHYDRIRQHLVAIEKGVQLGSGNIPGAGKEAADQERDRINSILRSLGRAPV